jgi:tetratricopeptide (TPR) repeat protein
MVAGALAQLGYLLSETNQPRRAVAAIDALAARCGESSDPELRVRVATALQHKATALDQLGEAERRLGVYREIFTRFGDATDPQLQVIVAQALCRLADASARQGATDVVAQTCDKIVQRFGAVADPQVRTEVARALLLKGHALEVTHPMLAAETYGELRTRFVADAGPDIVQLVVYASERRAALLARLDHDDDALGEYEELLVRVSDATDGPSRDAAARALSGRAALLAASGQVDEALLIYRGIDARLDEETDTRILSVLAAALLSGALLHVQQQHFAEALDLYEHVITRCHAERDMPLRRIVALALNNQSQLLEGVGRTDEAIAAHRRMIDEFGQEAIAALEEATREHPFRPAPAPANIAGVSFKKAVVLAELGQSAEAAKVLSDVIGMLERETGPEPELVLRKARELRASLLDDEAAAREGESG